MESLVAKQSMVSLNGELYPAVDARYRPELMQEALQRAKDERHAKCHCSPMSPLSLVVKSRGGKFYLAAWPDQAHEHAPHCPFFSVAPDAADSGQRDAECVKPLSPMLAVPEDTVDPPPLPLHEAPIVKPPVSDLWALVHDLWGRTRLNTWTPGWRRDWSFVRASLLKCLDKMPELEAQKYRPLYVPPVFVQEKRAEINALYQDFCTELNASGASGVVLGVVVDVTPTRDAYLFRLQHGYQRIEVSRALYDTLAASSRHGWQEMNLRNNSSAVVIGLFRVTQKNESELIAHECLLMRVGPRFIPSNFSIEDEFISILIKDGHAFVRPLTYEQSHKTHPNFVLLDEHGRSTTEIYIIQPSFPAHRLDSFKQEKTRSSKSNGNKVLFWSKGDHMPPQTVSSNA